MFLSYMYLYYRKYLNNTVQKRLMKFVLICVICYSLRAQQLFNYIYFPDISLAYAPVIEDIRPFLGILVGVVASIILVALIIVVIVRMRGSSGRDRNNYMHGAGRRHNNNGLGSLHNRHNLQNGRGNCNVTSSLDSIDKNPDIIPQGAFKLHIIELFNLLN